MSDTETVTAEMQPAREQIATEKAAERLASWDVFQAAHPPSPATETPDSALTPAARAWKDKYTRDQAHKAAVAEALGRPQTGFSPEWRDMGRQPLEQEKRKGTLDVSDPDTMLIYTRVHDGGEPDVLAAGNWTPDAVQRTAAIVTESGAPESMVVWLRDRMNDVRHLPITSRPTDAQLTRDLATRYGDQVQAKLALAAGELAKGPAVREALRDAHAKTGGLFDIEVVRAVIWWAEQHELASTMKKSRLTADVRRIQQFAL